MANKVGRMVFFFTKTPCRLMRQFSTSPRYCQKAQPLDLPRSEAEPFVASPKIENLVDQIVKLNLIEVTELNTALKKKLNLPDTPMMSFGAAPVAAAAPAEAEETPQIVKSNFTVKLNKFDDSKKVALIKEIKGLLTDMNLVQAKKFVESAPIIIKADVNKEEADKLKETLEKVGAEILIH